MISYNHQLKEHLSEYKRERLGVAGNGIWRTNKKNYPHILPEELKTLNIIECFRKEFWGYYSKHLEIKLHSDFHHLNSSQAMTFNLFYPFVYTEQYHKVLLKSLGIEGEYINSLTFEYIPDKKELTNFDFFIKLRSGRRLFFEMKLSEPDFGNAKAKPSLIKKLETVYKERLKNKVPDKFLEPDMFFPCYQILRNVSHLDLNKNDHLFLIYPKSNRTLRKSEKDILTIISPKLNQNVNILYLEDYHMSLMNLCNNDNTFLKLLTSLTAFGEKYIIGDSKQKK